MKVHTNQQYQVWHGDDIEGILDVEWKYLEQDLVRYSCIYYIAYSTVFGGFMFADNNCFYNNK